MKYKSKQAEINAVIEAVKFEYTNQTVVNEFLSNHGYTANYFAERRPGGDRWCEISINEANPPKFYKDENRTNKDPYKIPAGVMIIAHDDDCIFYESEKAFLERYELAD